MLDEALRRATAQVGAGEFFEAHDTLEEEWHHIPDGELRIAVQGLIQVCAGLHKRSEGKAAGAKYLLERGVEKVQRCGRALPSGAAAPFLERARLPS
jgi:predicted metal-dependent hydrolase